jgi:bifunctional non-homologous end joining protein LigD
MLVSLRERLKPLQTAAAPFDEPIRPRPAGAHWVRSALVAQVGFAEWTAAGRMRQARFLGLREDKAADEVVRERSS